MYQRIHHHTETPDRSDFCGQEVSPLSKCLTTTVNFCNRDHLDLLTVVNLQGKCSGTFVMVLHHPNEGSYWLNSTEVLSTLTCSVSQRSEEQTDGTEDQIPTPPVFMGGFVWTSISTVMWTEHP